MIRLKGKLATETFADKRREDRRRKREREGEGEGEGDGEGEGEGEISGVYDLGILKITDGKHGKLLKHIRKHKPKKKKHFKTLPLPHPRSNSEVWKPTPYPSPSVNPQSPYPLPLSQSFPSTALRGVAPGRGGKCGYTQKEPFPPFFFGVGMGGG